MRTSFAHIADVHLGNRQYGLDERFDDFGRAFADAVDRAIDRRVRFVLIAGDLFHRRAVEPLALRQALHALKRLREAAIPVIAVDGNHDRALSADAYPWTRFLSDEGFLTLLDAIQPGQGVRYAPWDPETGIGSWVDVEGVRVVGQQYLGASAGAACADMAAQMAEAGRGAAYVVFMCHAGLEGVIPSYPGCLPYEALTPLRPHVDYVALGHIHRRYARDGWVYNPGSLEVCGFDEADAEHGFHVVEVDTASTERHRVLYEPAKRRPFVRLRLDMGGCDSPAEVDRAVARAAAAARADGGAAPVAEVALTGQLRFRAAELDLRALEALAREGLGALHVEMRCHAAMPGVDPDEYRELSRDELETAVLTALFDRDERRRTYASGWAELARGVKDLALADAVPEVIAETVERAVRGLRAGDAAAAAEQTPC